MRVSNPQRIATNSNTPRAINAIPACFKPSKDRYKRITSEPLIPRDVLFQTLKGSLQTPPNGTIPSNSQPVSNPQRIATNRNLKLTLPFPFVCFKPSKDRYKPGAKTHLSNHPTCFKPSKDRYKHVLPFCIPTYAVPCFKPSKDRYKLNFCTIVIVLY